MAVEGQARELRIWRRALSGVEASSLAIAVKGYGNWRADNFTAAQLADLTVSGDHFSATK